VDKAVDAIRASGFVITGINRRYDESDGSPVVIPLARYGFLTAGDAADAALRDLHKLGPSEGFVEFTWTSA